MPSKVEVCAKLTELGVEHDPNAPMSDLFLKLREAKESKCGEVKSPEEKKPSEDSPDESPKGEVSKGVMLENVKHNGVFYKKDSVPEVDEATAELFRSAGQMS